jgi:hypothetical protein
MLDRIISLPRHIRPFLNRRRRVECVILHSDGIWLEVLVTVLVTGPGLGFEDDVHPAIITVAPAITTSTKMVFFHFLFLPHTVWQLLYNIRLMKFARCIVAPTLLGMCPALAIAFGRLQVLRNVETQRFHRG